MAVPKRKVSKSRKAMRSANKGLDLPQLAVDPADGSRYLRHRVNPTTGMYRGRQVVSPKVEED